MKKETSDEHSEDDETRFQDFDEYDHPMLKFDKWKIEVIRKIGPGGSIQWGNLGSDHRVFTLSILSSHLKHMLEYAKEYPDHKNEIIQTTLDLVLLKELDIPQEIYDHVLEAISFEELEKEERLLLVLGVIEKKFWYSRLVRECQTKIRIREKFSKPLDPEQYHAEEESEYEEYPDEESVDNESIQDDSVETESIHQNSVENKTSFKAVELNQRSLILDKLYKKITVRAKQDKPVNILSGRFSSKLKIFLARFKSDLTAGEVSTWMNKLSFTITMAAKCSDSRAKQARPRSLPSVNELPFKLFQDLVAKLDETETADLKRSISNEDKSLKLPLGATAKLSYELRNIKPDKNVVKQVEGLFAKALVEKELSENEKNSSKVEDIVTDVDENDEMPKLPDVPMENQGNANDNDLSKSAIDQEIEESLMKLKFFNRVWLSCDKPLDSLEDGPSYQNDFNSTVTPGDSSSDPADKTEPNKFLDSNFEPAEVSKKIQDDFNTWYDEQLDARNNSNVKNNPKPMLSTPMPINSAPPVSSSTQYMEQEDRSRPSSYRQAMFNTLSVWQPDMVIVIIITMFQLLILNMPKVPKYFLLADLPPSHQCPAPAT